jgi:hypothetical protein
MNAIDLLGPVSLTAALLVTSLTGKPSRIAFLAALVMWAATWFAVDAIWFADLHDPDAANEAVGMGIIVQEIADQIAADYNRATVYRAIAAFIAASLVGAALALVMKRRARREPEPNS